MTRCVFVSDTHCQAGATTQAIIAAKADVLIHCGDATGVGKISEVGDFADWCQMLLRKGYTKNVVFIAGNHDLLFCADHKTVKTDWISGPETCRARLEDAGVVYLQDTGATVAGLKLYGVPWTPRFFDWAFQIDTPEQDEAIFSKVPAGLDVLITHGPPHGVLDRVPRGELVGSRALMRALDRARPRVHAYGHIHEGFGMQLLPNGVLCINASTCTGNYKPTNPPIVINL